MIVLFFLFFLKTSVSAESNYVLPYPSAMPGSIFYKVHFLLERASKYWYFGDFGQFNYNLKFSDKYLVEAKILFEYNQYLLASQALGKSDRYFEKIHPNLEKAKNNGKNIKEQRQILGQAAKKHIEILTALKKILPENFIWTPEKSTPTSLNFKDMLNHSIEVRMEYL